MEVINCIRILRSEMYPAAHEAVVDLPPIYPCQPGHPKYNDQAPHIDPEGYMADNTSADSAAGHDGGDVIGITGDDGEMHGSAIKASPTARSFPASPIAPDHKSTSSDETAAAVGAAAAVVGAAAAGAIAAVDKPAALSSNDPAIAPEIATAPSANIWQRRGKVRALPPLAMAAAGEVNLRSPGAAPMAAAAAIVHPDGAATNRIDCSSPTSFPKAQEAPRYQTLPKSLQLGANNTSTNTSANAAAALAAARIRRARQMHNNRLINSGGVGIAGGNGAVSATALQAKDDDDDIADRLVAGYSSNGSIGDSGDRDSDGCNGSPERRAVADNGTAGVAALHGMLRRQRPTGVTAADQPGVSSAVGFSSGITPAALGSTASVAAAGAVAAGGAPKGHLATAAAANFRKAFRAVRRSILDDSGSGNGSGAVAAVSGSCSEGSASDGNGHVGERMLGSPSLASVAGGDGGMQLHRPPPRRWSELVKTHAPAAAAALSGASAGSVGLFNRLRSLAAGRGDVDRDRVGGTLEGLNEMDEGEENDVSFQPMPSAKSEFFPSRNGSQMLSTVRSPLRGGGNAQAGLSPLQLSALPPSAGGEASKQAFANVVATRGDGGDRVAAGRGAFARASSRVGGNALVAEMSLASMTMRRNKPIGQMLSSSTSPSMRSFRRTGFSVDVTDGVGGSSTQSSRRSGLAIDGSDGVGGCGTGAATAASTIASPSGMPTSSSSSMAPSPSQQPQPSVWAKLPFRASRKMGLGANLEAIPYGIQEVDGEEKEDGEKATDQDMNSGGAEIPEAVAAHGWAESLRRGSETRPCHAAACRASPSLLNTAPSLPSRIASFTSSFLQRARSRKLGVLPAIVQLERPPSGETGARPYSGTLDSAEAQRRRGEWAAPVGSSSGRMASNIRSGVHRSEILGDGKPAGGGGSSVSLPLPSPLSPPLPSMEQQQTSAAGDRACNWDTAATAMAMSQRPVPRFLSRIELLSDPEHPAADMRDDKRRCPSGSLSGVSSRSPMGARLSLAAASTPPLPSPPRLPPLDRFSIGPNAPIGGHRRPRSSDQQDPGGAALPPTSGASGCISQLASTTTPTALQAFPSRRSAYSGAGIRMYSKTGSGRARAGCGTVAAAAATAAAGPHACDMSIGGGGGSSSRGGLFSSLHNFLGLTPQQGQATAGTAGPISPRTSTVHPSSTVLIASGIAGPSGGGGSVTSGRPGRQRSLLLYAACETPDGGGSCIGGSAQNGLRNQRRRSVIEISGNVLTLNAGTSYAAGGWPVAVESDAYGYVGSSIMLADQSYGGISCAAAAAEADTLYDGTYDFADLANRTTYSGPLSAAFRNVASSASATSAAPIDPYAAPSSPRRRQSQRRLSILTGRRTGSGSGGSKTRTEASERTFSLWRQPSRRASNSTIAESSLRYPPPPSAAVPSPTLVANAASPSAVSSLRHKSRSSLPITSGGAAANSRNGGGGATSQTEQWIPAAGIESESSNIVSGLGRFVRGLSGIVSRTRSATRSGRQPHSGNSRQIYCNHTPSTTAAAIARSGNSATVGMFGRCVMEVGAQEPSHFCSTASALPTENRRMSSSPCDSSHNSDTSEKPSGAPAAISSTSRPMKSNGAISRDASNSGEMVEEPPAAVGGHRLVPEVSKSALQFVNMVISVRSIRSDNGAAVGVADGSGGEVASANEGIISDGGGKAATQFPDHVGGASPHDAAAPCELSSPFLDEQGPDVVPDMEGAVRRWEQNLQPNANNSLARRRRRSSYQQPVGEAMQSLGILEVGGGGGSEEIDVDGCR
ncbi:hypothetical protein Vretifemale_9990 [Volvox reticuliferus]|nr:hypothetical protein Vretifemale_9990 [Volvox reticuliferus]